MKRRGRPITATYLQNAAAFYLERYASSAEGLRRVLQRRVRKAQMLEAPVMENVEQAIEAVVQKFVTTGLLDDKSFAETKALSLHRRGASDRLTRQRLQAAGVAQDTVDRAMASLDDELGASTEKRELKAAARLAQRRRLGPHRTKDREDHRQRDLAALARAGFALAVARKVIDAADAEALAATLDEA